MSKLHPDKQHSQQQSSTVVSNIEDKFLSATDVTRAYDVIKRPHSRALHLLELANNMSTDDNSSGLSNELLMKIMDVREAVDDANSDEEVKLLLVENNARMKEAYQCLSDAFAKREYDVAKRITEELRYWEACDETLREKMDSVD